ncbi:unnamed protein product [Sphagnum troendelagicum]|uniref:Uncharacterized protein n=1 Tax=Sphagnum troendelagicum TaxID=128251 RepID=A0ABP0UJV6_9BRYO
MYQEGHMVSDDEDGGSDELSTPYASAHSSPARLQSSPEEEEADDDDKLLVDQRDTFLYGEVRASVPFNWEESPGKPKLKFSERNHNNNLQIVAAAAAAANGLLTEEYVGCWDPALQASPDQLQHLLPTPRRLLPLPPRLKAVKSNLQIAAAAADSRVVVVQHRRTSSLDSLPSLHLYKPEATSFPVQQQQQQQGCGEEEKPKDFWRRLFKEKLLITRRKTVPKTSLGSAAAGPAGQLLLDAASSWETERAKKTTEEETAAAAAAAAARPANHRHHHHHQLLLLNGTDEKKWLQQQQGNHSNVHHHSQQQHLSPSRSNSCRPQSVPQKPIPSIRSPAAITPHGMRATSPVTASGREQQQREIMFPYNIRLLTSCLGFPPIKTYRSSSSEFRSLVYGSP